MENQPSKPEKYLLFSMSHCKRGMDTVFRILNLIFREAQHLDRIPVIGKFTIEPFHNLGGIRTDLCFDDYLDLSRGVTKYFEQGRYKSVASHLDWIREEDLNLESYFFDKVYSLSSKEIVTETMNQRYDVLIRRDPTFKYVRTCTQYKYDNARIDFPYAENVNRLTDEVLDVLGISRDHAMTAQRYFLSRENNIQPYGESHDLQDNIPLDDGYYACMHVRASDRASKWPVFAFTSSKKQIKSVLAHTVCKGAKIYIMSDIHRPDFFDFLKSDYRVYQYYDFPKLRQLVSGDRSLIDNVMLYLVEKSIMKYATVKILSPHKGPMIYRLNTIYDTSFLKSLPTKRFGRIELRNFVSTWIQKLGLTDIFGS